MPRTNVSSTQGSQVRLFVRFATVDTLESVEGHIAYHLVSRRHPGCHIDNESNNGNVYSVRGGLTPAQVGRSTLLQTFSRLNRQA